MLKQKQSLEHEELYNRFRKGLRKGKRKKLIFLDKTLFRAAMEYPKCGRTIVNGLLVEKLLRRIEKLEEIGSMRLIRREFERAVEMFKKGKEKREGELDCLTERTWKNVYRMFIITEVRKYGYNVFIMEEM